MKSFDDYIMIVCSTQNQVVNYIPIIKLETKNIYSITIKDENNNILEDNNKWDKNLEKSLGNNIKIIDYIKLMDSDIYDVEALKNDIYDYLENNNLEKEKILWNITGGQRGIIMAIISIVQSEDSRKDDVFCYLEGNNNKIVLLNNKFNKIESIDTIFNKNELNIEKILKLAGYNVNDTKTSRRNFLVEEVKYKDEESLYEKLFKYYKCLEYNNDFIKKFIETNTKGNQENNKLHDELISIIEKNIDDLSENEKNIFSSDIKKNKAFGYILEKITAYQVKKYSSEILIDVSLSEKLSSNHSQKNNIIDEFDLALLTKYGKLIIFECKSGGMSGDVAKSTKYSTYATSGVYGTPVLITPLLQKNVDKAINDTLKDEEFKNIKLAIQSAKRANLEVWGLDEIENKLKELIK